MKKFFVVIFLLMLPSNIVQARWANYEDAAIEIEFYNNDLVINEDGSDIYTIATQEKILKESGRDNAVSYRLNYNGGSSALTILEAKTINENGESVVTKDMIEDKPLASVGYGFDEQRQILISYPNVGVGSKIYPKYQVTESKVPLQGFFAQHVYFGTGAYWRNGQFTVNSKLPLYIKVNDPSNSLNITKDHDDKFYNARIVLTKPLYQATLNEPKNGVINHKHLTWVSISSMDLWENLGSRLGKRYMTVINQPLPPLFEDIEKLAGKYSKDTEIINFVTSQVNEKIQYMGDWRSVEGGYFPRDLEKIATTQVGDCKDFTASTAAILQKIGFKVNPALVLRGVYTMSLDNSLPSIYNFNHVMLRVIGKDKTTYWIDPTNITSMAGGIFPDIAGKETLILDEKNPTYTTIPNIDPNHSKVVIKNNLAIKNQSDINDKGTVLLIGEQAEDFTGYALYFSQKQIEDKMFQLLSGKQLEEYNKKAISLPDLKSRIVEDLSFTYEYERNNALFKTNLGYALPLSSEHWLREIISAVPSQVTDLFIGSPFTFEKYTCIKNAKINKFENLNYEAKTPWVIVTRKLSKQEDGNIMIHDKVSILRSFISKEALDSDDYKRLKKNLEKNMESVSIVF